MMLTHISPSNNGSQRTVAMTRGSAGDKPSGLRTPNQIKMIPNEMRKESIPQRRINVDIERSILSKFICACIVCTDIFHMTEPVTFTGKFSSIVEKAAGVFKIDFAVATLL